MRSVLVPALALLALACNVPDPVTTHEQPLTSDWALRGTFNGWGVTLMERRGDAWQAEVSFAAAGRFKFDRRGDWSDNYGDDDRDGLGDPFGADIPVATPGRYRIVLEPRTRSYRATRVNDPAPGEPRRTVVFVQAATVPGQQVRLRSPALGDDAVALAWTTDAWPASWGPARTVRDDGYGVSPLNRWGAGYWLLDVALDCGALDGGRFLVEATVDGGAGWDAGDHEARCGHLNVFRFGDDVPLVIEPLEPVLEVAAVDPFPSPHRLVLQRIEDRLEPRWAGARTRDRATVRLRNQGARPVTVHELAVVGAEAGDFAIDAGTRAALPLSLAAGEEHLLEVRFDDVAHPDWRTLRTAALVVGSDAPAQSLTYLTLAGYNMVHPEGHHEPPVTDVLASFGYTTRLVGPGQALAHDGEVETVGDEVLAPLWEAVDPTRPVQVRQITAFHSCCEQAASLMWYPRGGAPRWLMAHLGSDGQSLLPRRDDGARAATSFQPDGPFGLLLDGKASEPAQNGGLHLVRAWPLADERGRLPGTHLVVMDYPDADGTPGNLDYNDNDYVLENARPYVETSARPWFAGATLEDGTTGVGVRAGITARVTLTAAGGVDNRSVGPASVRLVRIDTGDAIASVVNSTGGGDAITLQPVEPLAPFTCYRFVITAAVEDVSGTPFLPFVASFRTGASVPPEVEAPPAAFTRRIASAAGDRPYTVVAFAAGSLYAGTLLGELLRFPVLDDTGELGAPVLVAHFTDGDGTPRTLTGLHADPSDAGVLWVSHGGLGAPGAPDWSGRLTRLSGPGLAQITDVVVGLPHSARDHMTNGLDFGPDGAIYLAQGSNTAMGAPDAAWAWRPERLLSAAILRVEPGLIATPPLDVRSDDAGAYDPFAPGAPVTLYATGVRNAYDLVWHSSGHLFVPVNGSAAGGNAPATPAAWPASCARRAGVELPVVTGLAQVTASQPDLLLRVVAGSYHGHPNPARCEWVLGGGNPSAGSDPHEVAAYPVGTLPDPAWRDAAADLGLHKSPNGIIEARAGALAGRLVVARYSQNDDLLVLDLDAEGEVRAIHEGLPGLTGFVNPLDLSEDPGTGVIWVAELTSETAPSGQLRVLTPVAGF